MGKIIVPEVGESITEGVISSWLKEEGDQINAGESIYELETDKITTEVPADESGLLKILIAAGERVEIGAEIGAIEPASTSQPVAKESTAEVETQPEPTAVAPSRATAAVVESKAKIETLSPAVRRMLSEHQVDPTTVQATGAGGRLLKEDVELFVANRDITAVNETVATKVPSMVEPPAGDRTTRKKMTTLRQRIAERLVASQHETATLTTFNEVDMSAIIELRQGSKEKFKEVHGVNLGFMGFFVKAAVAALKEVPEVNATIEGDEIVYNHFYDIGIAVSTDKGLIVPVLRDADRLNFAEIERGIHSLAIRARDSKLTLNELKGGTFTISNGGIFGSMLSTPILNPPQTGILGMHNIQKRPVVVGEQIVPRPIMYLALSYDHRLIDGREAVTFLKTVKEYIESPGKFLLSLF